MNLMQKVYFDAVLSNDRKGIEQENNIEVYALKTSFFDDDILWRFSLYCVGVGCKAYGFIEKVQNDKKLKFSWEEAKEAIRGNFLEVESVSMLEESRWKFNPPKGELRRCIAFTLRTWINSRKALENWKCWEKTQKFDDVENVTFWLETGDIKDRNKVSNVHGLITLQHECSNIESYAHVLSRIFPKNLVTWLSFCSNPRAYRRKLISEFPLEYED